MFAVSAIARLQAAVPQSLPVRVPEGFVVELYADDDLATNITAMTVDHRGRVVVAGPGYIRILHDDDNDGRADWARQFVDGHATGARGMVFVPEDRGAVLYCSDDDGIRICRLNNDDRVDGPLKSVLAFGGGEHGLHGICQGPDGDLYILYGNDPAAKTVAGVTQGISRTTEQCGLVYRASFKSKDGFGLTVPMLEIAATGFCNPHDLDFNAAGRLFTADADNERDVGLPWYTPARLFDVAWGRDHGWLNAGREQGWNRPGYFYDSVRPVCELGRAAPTGLTFYRHRQFPERYRDGAFSACWMFGRVQFLPLVPQGSSYTAQPETFLEITGDTGLTPVDLAVGPDGSLFVACGGRGTRGTVWRVRYVGNAEDQARDQAAREVEKDYSRLEAVLLAHQPLAAWSRAGWIPIAKQIGKEPFIAAIADPRRTVAEQVRAVEVLLELFEPLALEEAREAVKLGRPELSARIAWLVARQRVGISWPDVLCELTFDPDPRVRLAAWEGLPRSGFSFARINPEFPNWLCTAEPALDERVRNFLVDFRASLPPAPPSGPNGERAIKEQRAAYDQFWAGESQELGMQYSPDAEPAERLRQLRRIQRFYGNFAHKSAQPEVHAGYRRLAESAPTVHQTELCKLLTASFPSGHREVDRELTRTLLVFRDVDPTFVDRLVTMCTSKSRAADDVHYLTAASTIIQLRSPDLAARTAAALLRLDAKLRVEQMRPGVNWSPRLTELFVASVERDAQLVELLAVSPEFGRPEHARYVELLPAEARVAAAQRLVDAVLKLPEEEVTWTKTLIDVFAQTSRPEALAKLRELWREPGLRDFLFPALLQASVPDDRPKFVDRLTSADPEVVARAAVVLRRPAPEWGDEAEMAAAVRGLRQMCTVPSAGRARNELTTLIGLWGDADFEIVEPAADRVVADAAAIRDAYQPVFLWFTLKHYQASAGAAAPHGVAPAKWRKQLLVVDWEHGNPVRGRELFDKKLCVRCHMGDSVLGPNLDDAASRYARSELMATVFEPSRFVPPRYRPTTVDLADGRQFSGIPIAEAGDLLLLQTGADTVVRIRGDEIAARRTTTQSIMPLGMLTDFSSDDLADLYAYLQSLAGRLDR
ncbi:MAG: hypothetical protein C0483_17905 [Pirellula sp.]|nr:hypothetical protein [Pirellula sp.]